MENLEPTPYVEESLEPVQPKRWLPWLVGAFVLVVVLGAAAFLAGRLMNRPELTQASGMRGGGPAISIRTKGGPGGAAEKSFTLNIKPAPELPARSADVNGVFTQRQDNSLFVGTGNIGIRVTAGDGDEPSAESSYDGPVLEVVVTQDTRIYRDVTQIEIEHAEGEIQQELELAGIEDIGPNSNISAWGKKVGDRIIAEVIFFNQPYLMKAPKGK